MDIKRKHLRFNADNNTFTAVKLDEETIYGGLAITESQGGCSSIFLNKPGFSEGKKCYLKVGQLNSIYAEIRWIKELDAEVIKVGFQYLE